MKASPRPSAIEEILTAITGRNRVEAIEAGECTTCSVKGLLPDMFVDEISRKEYTISGMCQDCQDKVFGMDPFDISMDLEDY